MSVTLLLLIISARTSSFLRRHSLIRDFDVVGLLYLLTVVGHIIEINLVNIRLVVLRVLIFTSRRMLLVGKNQISVSDYFSVWS